MSGKCEHGLTTRECFVCASAKYGATDNLEGTAHIEAGPSRRLVQMPLDTDARVRRVMEAVDKLLWHSRYTSGANARAELERVVMECLR